MNTDWICVHPRKSVAKFFDCGEGGVTCVVIRIEYGFDVFGGLINVIVHHAFDNLWNFGQMNPLVQKRTDCFFVCGVHGRGQRPAFS